MWDWPLAMRNFGMRSTFQSLPLPIDSGGVSGRLKRLYSYFFFFFKKKEKQNHKLIAVRKNCRNRTDSEAPQRARRWQNNDSTETNSRCTINTGSQMRCTEGCSNILISFIDPSSHFYLFQRGDGGALSAVVGVPVHVQNLFPIHRHDPGQNAFLHDII